MLHHVFPFSHPLTPLTTYLSLYVQGLCPLAKRRLRRDETPAAHSASARCEVDGDGMGAVPDKTRGFPGFDPPGLALIRDFATRPHVSPSTAFSPHLTHLSLSLQRFRQNM